jgi:GNAT superfamily N-acetyltransferase
VSKTLPDVTIRRADRHDVPAMAEAHRDSIRSIGAPFYSPGVADAWAAAVHDDMYLAAMARGEVFFIATRWLNDQLTILGFASAYPIEGSTHGISAYVRGCAARQGLGSALLSRAESHALACGAETIQIEASLAGVSFYRANGYIEGSRGMVRLMSGTPIECVSMRKDLVRADAKIDR